MQHLLNSKSDWIGDAMIALFLRNRIRFDISNNQGPFYSLITSNNMFHQFMVKHEIKNESGGINSKSAGKYFESIVFFMEEKDRENFLMYYYMWCFDFLRQKKHFNSYFQFHCPLMNKKWAVDTATI